MIPADRSGKIKEKYNTLYQADLFWQQQSTSRGMKRYAETPYLSS